MLGLFKVLHDDPALAGFSSRNLLCFSYARFCSLGLSFLLGACRELFSISYLVMI
jgi:hypothetical protein